MIRKSLKKLSTDWKKSDEEIKRFRDLLLKPYVIWPIIAVLLTIGIIELLLYHRLFDYIFLFLVILIAFEELLKLIRKASERSRKGV